MIQTVLYCAIGELFGIMNKLTARVLQLVPKFYSRLQIVANGIALFWSSVISFSIESPVCVVCRTKDPILNPCSGHMCAYGRILIYLLKYFIVLLFKSIETGYGSSLKMFCRLLDRIS